MQLSKATPSRRRIHQAAFRLFSERGATQVSVSELADYAGVSRGTVYNNVNSVETLFSQVATAMSEEMNDRVVASLGDVSDPALRLAFGIRWYVKRAHDDPDWNRFVTRFAFNSNAMRSLWSGPVAQDVIRGVAESRYIVAEEEMLSVMAFVGSTVLSALYLVREGYATWRDAGTHCAALVLRALGVSPEEARQLASMEMPNFSLTDE